MLPIVNEKPPNGAKSTHVLIACAGAAVGTLIFAVIVVSVFIDPASASLFFEWYAPVLFLVVAAMWYPILSRLLQDKER